MTSSGVVVPLSLTHRLLAQMTCLRRPTVSAALGQLAESREISSLPDGGWLLHGGPPDALRCEARHRDLRGPGEQMKPTVLDGMPDGEASRIAA